MERKKTLIWYLAIAVALVAILVSAGVIVLRDQEKPIEESAVYTVTFQDFDGTVLKTETVTSGEAATAPENPQREGYTFVSWDKDFSDITEDAVIKAEYLRSTDAVFAVETVTVQPGTSKVDVRVTVTNNPGILGMMLSVNYDEKQLKLVEGQTGSVLSRLSFQKPSNYADGCGFLWYGSETGEVTDGEILRLTFEILETAGTGLCPISLSWDARDIYDGNCDMIDPEVTSGGIEISN